MNRICIILILCWISNVGFSQQAPPDYIKTIQLQPTGNTNTFSPIVPLGTVLELSFDDLEADQKNYYYRITQKSHDWTESSLLSSQYIDGFQQNIILDVQNAFNTFQNYSHYTLEIPNTNTIITKSGNYELEILDEDDQLIFSRRFVLYEDAATVGVRVSRSRNTTFLKEQQTVQFTVNHPGIRINNPAQEIHTAIIQNLQWQSAITGLQPQFFRNNQLVYTYTRQSNFWGGNEFLNFDTKIIRNKSINIKKVERKKVYHNYLHTYTTKEVPTYTFNPDINGQFIIRTLEGNDPATEADYARIHFSLSVPDPQENESFYVFGAFNNFQLTEENKLHYNTTSGMFETSILLKQGFYNYTFVGYTEELGLDIGRIMGSFSKTENEYTVLVYYKPMGGLYDRVIGVGTAYFTGER